MLAFLFLIGVLFCVCLGLAFSGQWRRDFPRDSWVCRFLAGVIGFFIGIVLLAVLTGIAMTYILLV